MIDGALPTTYLVRNGHTWSAVDGAVIEEHNVSIFVNGQEAASLMCSPVDLEALAIGFLYNEGLIDGLDEVELVELSHKATCVDIWLRKSVSIPERSIRTSGCGGGVTFDDLNAQPYHIPSGTAISAQQVTDRYFELRAVEKLYAVARGVHASALCTPTELLLWAEDVGRHNTLDKLAGRALSTGTDTRGLMLVTTGRVSGEMLGKAARMGVSLVASRTSPTSKSVALAEAWNMTLIGYVRRTGLRVYTATERILPPTGELEYRLEPSAAL